jgi:hypothetical protein
MLLLIIKYGTNLCMAELRIADQWVIDQIEITEM